MKFLLLTLFLGLLFTHSAWSQSLCSDHLLSQEAISLGKAENLFMAHFEQGYRSGYCGDNIAKFIKKSLNEGVNLKGSIMMEIEGYGGLTGYAARGPGSASQTTWQSHHVILLVPTKPDAANLLTDYRVIDFDFTNEPKVIGFKQYMEEMLIPPYKRNDPAKIRSDFELGLIKFNGMDATKIYRYFEEADPHVRHAIRLESQIFTGKKFKPTYFGE